MPKINTVLQNIEELIADTKAKHSISHMKDENGGVATWESKVWRFTDNRYNTFNFYFCKVKGNISLLRAKTCEPLKSPLREVLMLYALDVSRMALAPDTIKQRVRAARHLVQACGSLDTMLCQQKREDAMRAEPDQKVKTVNIFLAWLNNKECLHKPLSPLPYVNTKHLIGEEIIERRRKRMPKERVLMALGAIRHKVIPWDRKAWDVAPTSSQRDAFICTMTSLGLSAPNRMIAEQSVLNAQQLKTHTENKQGRLQTVHYLDWKGSKGFKDSANHILAGMADSVRLCLEYTLAATQPMRSLARFYTDPTLPLKKILKKDDVDVERWEQVNPDINKSTNLVKLGYLLGLYENLETPELMVVECVNGSTKRSTGGQYGNTHIRYFKPLWAIEIDDIVSCSEGSLERVFGSISLTRVAFNAIGIPYGAKHRVTIKELQSKWITHLKRQFPGFPKLSTGHANGQCDMRTMLFAFNGHQLASGQAGRAGYTIGRSPFAPVSPASFRNIVRFGLNANNKKNILIRHGFCESFGLTSHQCRHWLNTTALENGVSRQIVNLWSGRENPSQLLHYDHEIGADKVCRIGNIRFNESPETVEQAKKGIRIVGLEAYEKLTGQAATKTSSGVCTQNLSVKPCTFLNDFTVHCLFCPSSCHIAHDEKAAAFLKDDLEVQQRRLLQVSDSPKFSHSTGIQGWFRRHSTLAAILKQLIDLMTSKDIPEGAFIRLLADRNEFRVTNLKTKSVEIRKLSLPDIDKQIKELIDKQRQDEPKFDDVTSQLLEIINDG
ncbi:hypothetical protein KUW04_08825 [Halomonas denitrificans]|nr:hypothetical protein [Halomonas denitrificans]